MKSGIFFDGYHCVNFWSKDTIESGYKYGKIDFTHEIEKIISKIRKEKDVNLIYKAWFQGIVEYYFNGFDDLEKKDVEQLKKIVWQYANDRHLYIHLIRHGIESIFLEHALDENGKYHEKGIDNALTVNCLRVVEDLKLDCVILCTNDSDFEPLIHNLKKYGVYTVVVCFNPNSKVSHRLKRQADLLIDFAKI